jgi:hypothetical protein
MLQAVHHDQLFIRADRESQDCTADTRRACFYGGVLRWALHLKSGVPHALVLPACLVHLPCLASVEVGVSKLNLMATGS